jgi:hypothetical protein
MQRETESDAHHGGGGQSHPRGEVTMMGVDM